MGEGEEHNIEMYIYVWGGLVSKGFSGRLVEKLEGLGGKSRFFGGEMGVSGGKMGFSWVFGQEIGKK